MHVTKIVAHSCMLGLGIFVSSIIFPNLFIFLFLFIFLEILLIELSLILKVEIPGMKLCLYYFLIVELCD